MIRIKIVPVVKHDWRFESSHIKTLLDRAVLDALHELRMTLIEEAPYSMKKDPRHMHIIDYLADPQLSIRMTSRWRGYIYFDSKLVPHVKWLIKGTQAHRIPIAGWKYYLHWEDLEGTHHFATWVWHPGTVANNFISRSTIKSGPRIEAATKRIFTVGLGL